MGTSVHTDSIPPPLSASAFAVMFCTPPGVSLPAEGAEPSLLVLFPLFPPEFSSGGDDGSLAAAGRPEPVEALPLSGAPPPERAETAAEFEGVASPEEVGWAEEGGVWPPPRRYGWYNLIV